MTAGSQEPRAWITRTALGSDEREQAYQDISRFLVETPTHAPLAQFSTVVLAGPEVVGAEDLAKVVIGKLDFRGVGIAAW